MRSSLNPKQKILWGACGPILEKRVCYSIRLPLVSGHLVGLTIYHLDLVSIMRFITEKMAGHGTPKAQDLMG